MSRINLQHVINDYRQSKAQHATPERFAERINECQACECRVGAQCTQAKQLVTLMATTGIKCPKTTRKDDAPREATRNVALPPVDSMAVVTCHFNPCNYRRPIENFFRFRDGLKPTGLPLYVAELAYDDDAFQLPSQFQYRVSRERGTLWQKERLLNLAIKQLPDEYDAVAWIDADVMFLNPNWPQLAIEALSNHRLVQLYSEIHFTDKNGAIESSRPSRGHVYVNKLGKYGCPGLAWAARREDIPDGLYEYHIVGGGDSAAVYAWLNVESPIATAGTTWGNDFMSRCQVERDRIGGSVTCLSQSVVHFYHGTKGRRQYGDRYAILDNHGYDPATDLVNDPDSPLQWSDFAIEHKPAMVKGVRNYFAQRKEDL